MTLTSLSDRKLHPFFSFQRQNCFQKDGAQPHVIRFRLFMESTNGSEPVSGSSLDGKCAHGSPAHGRGQEPGAGRGLEGCPG